MSAWFNELMYWYGECQMPVVLFPFASVFRDIVWPALALYLPFIAIAALALWGVGLVFGKRG